MEILYKWPFKEFQEPGNVNIPPLRYLYTRQISKNSASKFTKIRDKTMII